MKDFTFNIIIKQNGVMQRFETNANEKDCIPLVKEDGYKKYTYEDIMKDIKK